MSLRVQKRAAATGEWANSTNAAAEAPVLAFEEDRRGSHSKRRRLQREAAEQALVPSVNQSSTVSRADQAVLKKILNKPRIIEQEEESQDIWGSVGPIATRGSSSVSQKANKAAPTRTLSYNPAFEEHQEALAEAFALELKKREEDKRKADGRLQSVPAIPVGQLDDEEDEDDEEEGDEEEDAADGSRPLRGLSRRKSMKLTRAQRNKIRARNIAGFTASIEKGEKDIVRSIDNVPALLRDIAADEQRRETEKELRRLRDEEARLAAGAMSYEEAGLVPLSDELGGSLRALLPKGVLIKTLEADMRKSGKLLAKDRRALRRGEKPHGGKNIRWVAKHKYT